MQFIVFFLIRQKLKFATQDILMLLRHRSVVTLKIELGDCVFEKNLTCACIDLRCYAWLVHSKEVLMQTFVSLKHRSSDYFVCLTHRT